MNCLVGRLAIPLALAVTLAQPSTGMTQGTRADYARADRLFASTQNKVFKAVVHPHWSANCHYFWYRNDLAGGATEYVVVDAVMGSRGPAFDHAKMAGALAKLTGRPQNADRLPIERLQIADDGATRLLVEGKTYRLDTTDGSLKAADPIAPDLIRAVGQMMRRGNPRRQDSPRGGSSPDGKWAVAVKGHDLRLKQRDSGLDIGITADSTDRDSYEPGVYWSPDSTHFVAIRHAKGDDRRVNLIESSPKDEIQPKLHSYDYLKPGDKIPIRKPHLFSVASGKEILLKDDLFTNPWAVDDIRWRADSSRFTFLYNQRGHQILRVVSVDTKGEAKALVNETSATFIDYSNKTFTHFINKSNDMIWMSERSGWNHLYRIDVLTGKVEHPITEGAWVVLGVDRVDDEKKQIWFRAGGIYPRQDPYYVHYARVNFDGTGLTLLTEGDGTHQIDYSPDGKFPRA